MKRLGRRVRPDGEAPAINVAPLMDMVFILLIFFVVTTVFVEETGIDVQKPSATSAKDLEKESILIAVTREGKIVHGGKEYSLNGIRALVARELSARPKVLLAAQPTRGVDIGAAELVHRQLIAARDGGAAVLLVSADLGELLALSDRLAVMYNGEIVALFDHVPALTEEELGYYMLGVKKQEDLTPRPPSP